MIHGAVDAVRGFAIEPTSPPMPARTALQLAVPLRCARFTTSSGCPSSSRRTPPDVADRRGSSTQVCPREAKGRAALRAAVETREGRQWIF
eukprot:734044-Prymnesium_polylepis.2